MKKFTTFVLAIICVFTTSFSALASSTPAGRVTYQEGIIVSEQIDSLGNEIFTVVTGDIVEEITITEDGVVYVNGRNITSITEATPPQNTRASSEWTYAGSYTYQYDLSGLTVAGGVSILKKLGKSLAASALKSAAGSYLVGAVFQSGCGLEDTRDTYYKNINQQRPDMKEVHSVNFYFDLYGSRQYQKYLCGFTTYA